MASEHTCWRELTELVTNHVFRAEHVDKRSSVVHLECVAYELGDDRACTCPCLQGRVLACFRLLHDLAVQLLVDVGTFFQ